MDLDVIVIGAGMGGMSAAIRLAASGLKVRVYEAMDVCGGKVGTAQANGVTFDTGPSLLTMIEHIDQLFQYAGTSLEEELTLVSHDTTFRYIYADGTMLNVHHKSEDTLESIRKTYGQVAASEFEAFLKYSKAIWEAALPNFVACQAPNYTSALVMGVTKFKSLLKIDPFHTMWESICKHVTHPHLRMLLARYATYNGSNPYDAPATLNCIAWVELGLGGFGIEGGMHQLAVAMQRVATNLGVEFVFGTPVSRIELDAQQKVTGVVLDDGKHIQGKQVVVNADATHLVETLLPDKCRHGIPDVNQRSMSGWNGVFTGPKSHKIRAAHTVVFAKNYEEEFKDIFGKQRPPQTPTVYLCDQTQSHRRKGWQDANPVFAMANAPCEPKNGQQRDALYEQLRVQVETSLSNVGLWDDDCQWVWQRRPRELASLFAGSYGSIYGSSSNSQLAAFRRPSNQSKQVPGLYLASGSAHPGGGVPMCIMSGQITADAILDGTGK